MRTILRCLLFAACVSTFVSCAAVQPPFASPEEVAIKRELTEKLAEYPGLKITVSGDRVYLEGEVLNKTELDHARSVVLETQGVKSVMDNVFLIQAGRIWDDEDRPPFNSIYR